MSETWLVHTEADLMDFIPTFLENRRKDARGLAVAIEKGDFEFVRRTAHTWKGICRPYGFHHLETLSHRLEQAGQAENRADSTQVLFEIEDFLLRVQVKVED